MKIKSEIGLKGWAVSLMLLLFILGCAKVEQVQGGAGEISYNVISNISTKAAQPYPTTSSFASWAWYLPDGSTWASDHTSSSLHINAAEIKYDSAGNSWHDLSTTHYWPKAGTLTFFALSPYSAAASATCDNINGITLPWDSDNSIDDIMVAEMAADYNNNTTLIENWIMGVPTVFHHKLSKIKINFAVSSYADEGTTVTVKKVYLLDIYTKGTYTKGGFSNDTWGNYDSFKAESDPLKLFEGTSDALIKGNAPVCLVDWKMVIPQRLVSNASGHPHILLEYDITTGGTTSTKEVECYFDVNLRHGAWEMGKQIEYNIYLGVGKYPIMFDDPSVSDWSTEDQGTVEIGG